MMPLRHFTLCTAKFIYLALEFAVFFILMKD